MISVHVTIKVASSNAESFQTLLRPCWQGCVKEEECLFFDVFTTKQEPDVTVFRFVEVWTGDLQWFTEVQTKKSYYEPYLSLTMPMWVEERKIEVLDRVPGWLHIKVTNTQS